MEINELAYTKTFKTILLSIEKETEQTSISMIANMLNNNLDYSLISDITII